MSEVEFGWVIRRDDGKFIDRHDLDFTNNLYETWIYAEDKKWMVEEDIRSLELQNCKPVKIEMRVVEDEKETQ